jgi:glycosyltransferase involved in cell wall biosynthesis
LRRLQPDLYHALAFVAPPSVPCPFVVTVYDLSFIRYPEALSTLRRRYLQTFTRSTCQRATRVIAISESTARDLVELMAIPGGKIDVALPGVTADFRPYPPDQVEEFRQQHKLPKRFCLFLGTLEPRKNLPMLLRAYASLTPAERQEVHLVLAGGKGWMYDEIFATIEARGLAETVHTPGYVAAETLPLWYNAAEAFVYPTLYEGFGIPIVEALACGAPVLASNCSSLPEAAGEVGALLPPHDEAAWAEALRQIIHHPQHRAEQAAPGQQWAATFTWERTARQTVASYQRAFETSNP